MEFFYFLLGLPTTPPFPPHLVDYAAAKQAKSKLQSKDQLQALPRLCRQLPRLCGQLPRLLGLLPRQIWLLPRPGNQKIFCYHVLPTIFKPFLPPINGIIKLYHGLG